jgi:hypothetical protein
MDSLYYKLKKEDIDHLVQIGVLKIHERNYLLSASKEREPGTFAKTQKIYLNKARTVYIQNIHFYGGESFGKPYYWLAEISGFTKTGLTRFFNQHRLRYPNMTY